MTHRRRRWRSYPTITGLASIALVAGLAIAGSSASATAPADQAASDASVERQVMDQLAADNTTTFWVYLRERADLSAAAEIADWADQGMFVYARLGQTAAASQSRLVGVLDRQHRAGDR